MKYNYRVWEELFSKTSATPSSGPLASFVFACLNSCKTELVMHLTGRKPLTFFLWRKAINLRKRKMKGTSFSRLHPPTQTPEIRDHTA